MRSAVQILNYSVRLCAAVTAATAVECRGENPALPDDLHGHRGPNKLQRCSSSFAHFIPFFILFPLRSENTLKEKGEVNVIYCW